MTVHFNLERDVIEIPRDEWWQALADSCLRLAVNAEMVALECFRRGSDRQGRRWMAIAGNELRAAIRCEERARGRGSVTSPPGGPT